MYYDIDMIDFSSHVIPLWERDVERFMGECIFPKTSHIDIRFYVDWDYPELSGAIEMRVNAYEHGRFGLRRGLEIGEWKLKKNVPQHKT